MVSETVLGAAIGVTGAVIGSLLTGAFNWLSTKQQVEAENTRRYADYFLQEKVESLSELHAQLERCRHNYQYNWERTLGMDEEEFRSDILGAFYDYETALGRATLFLDDQQRDAMFEALDAFRDANGYFDWYVRYGDPEDGLSKEPPDGVEFREDELLNAVKGARDVLREEISEPVKYFELVEDQ